MTQVTAPSPSTIAPVIASGASLSSATHVGGKLVGIIIPQAWTAAAITFQGCMTEDGTFVDIWDSATGTGAERVIASANIPTTNGRYLPLSLNDWLSVNYVKVRSGTSASPVNQGGDRTMSLILCG